MSGDRLSIHDQAQPMRRDTLLGAARQRREKLARLRRFLWRAAPDRTRPMRITAHFT